MSDDLRPDIAAAQARMQSKIGAKREIRRLIEYLWEGERVDYLASGQYGPGTGIVALTDRRLLFVKDGMMSKSTEDFPLEKIASVQWSSGMIFGTLIVFASGNKAEIKQMDKKDGKQIADALRDRISPGQTPATPAVPVSPPSASAGGQDVYAQLEQLAQLRERGVITDTEFEAKKVELLSRI
jgi:hypothetical protein